MNGLRSCLLVSLSAAAVILICGGLRVRAAQGPQPAFRSTVDLVMLHVSVTDRSGRYLPDLAQSEFTVLEDGRPQQLRMFERGGLPLQVMLFLDVSSSMRFVFPKVQDAAIEFLTQLGPRDVASVVGFADNVQILQSFTGDHHALVKAVRQAKPRGKTTLFNALYVGLNELNRPGGDAQTIPRRRVAVLLTDGDDTASLVRFEDLMDFARRTNIAIYAIRLIGRAPAPNDTGESQYILNQLTRQTRGRAFLSVADKDLGPVYEDIRMELARQYALGYVSNDMRRNGKFRYLSVQVSRPGVRARSRFGYFAPLLDSGTRSW